jgi:N-acetylglucosaminyldiphosphoundecaprenol N-acetyl-beta-D-mannosaminyltransferase
MVPLLNPVERTMHISILGVCVNPTSYATALKQVFGWVNTAESRFVCAANVHMLMEAHDSPQYRQIINSADLVMPDGMPLVWMMRLKGQRNQQRVYGPTLMLHVLEAATRENIYIGFYGSSPEVLRSLLARIKDRFSSLKVVYSFSPPFRELSQEEDEEIIKHINASSARILFVGLGCPKQEKWMAEHRGKVNAVMLGVGAAFDFHAGFKSQAPSGMQKVGLEWLYRLATEPRRLWRRYLYHNPRFVFLAILDLLGLLR